MALELSGREQEIVPLLKREAPITQCYVLLIKRLLEAGMRVEAKATAVEGFQLTIDKAPGIAWQLEDKLRRMAEEDKELSMVAAYRALEFFNHPSLESYKNLEKAAEAVHAWPIVKGTAMTFLQTGVRPDVKARTGKDKAVCRDIKLWPLPNPEISRFQRRWAIFPSFMEVLTFPLLPCFISINILATVLNISENRPRPRVRF
jgi:uncharacterized Zn finger protein